MRNARAFLAMMVLSLAVAAVGCPCNSVVNASPEIRWWLFSNFGASKICPEMLKRGVPIKVPSMGASSVGRFFPSQCQVQIDDGRKAMVTTVMGTGYLTLPFTRRIGFSVNMAVEYMPDFRLDDDATYVWGKFSRFIAQPDMRIMGVENPVVNLATQTPIGNVATVIGNGLVASEIGKGFTVVRREDGDDFAIGHLEPPDKPKRQFKAGEGHVLVASDLTSVYTRERDYLGPFEVSDNKASLFFHARVDGGPVTYSVVERSVGETWRRLYETAQPMGPPPGVLIGQGMMPAGESNLGFPLNPGTYYIVVENTAPPPLLGVMVPVGEQIANISYTVEIGDRQ